jgi:nucleotide-binding universal stress UspA family protein
MLRRSLYGSKIAKHERRPVMETVIIALDGRESERALPAAQELAKQFMSRIVIVHVNQLVIGGRGRRFPLHADESERLARLREVVAELRAEGFEADLETSTTSLGQPANIISASAERNNAGAIVLASGDRSPVVGALTGGVTRRLLHTAPCPVLVVTPGTTHETFRSIRRLAPAAA